MLSRQVEPYVPRGGLKAKLILMSNKLGSQGYIDHCRSGKEGYSFALTKG